MQTNEKSPLLCVEHHCPRMNTVEDVISVILPSSSETVTPPRPVKRPTRQWAAWTREEEESFFTALRQVGKNFEKITCRVQSKNKDQVRHYYYRLVRRMNKLLGPGLCLDAKNSKDTNAAMLRWWSLLEKYSCKASKLHLKPRRFKIFVETLEHQLLKDRKKNVRKRPSQGENFSSPTAFPNPSKTSGNDARAVKIVVVDSHNIQKTGQGKGSLTRRNSNIGVSRSSKGESFPTKSTRQRRKTGVVSTAAMKRWEKAAMAGVSLVADAAEHLERTAGANEADPHGGGLGLLSIQAVDCTMGSSGQVQENLQKNTESTSVENNVQINGKLKLQLFPVDESTRKALEMDKHNPHLELTLSARKKISSVLEHLDRKWGSSSVASGNLMLFPFNIQRENLLEYQMWTRNSVITAADVYAQVGSPSVFRLRYGWMLSAELQSSAPETPSTTSCGCHVRENERQHAALDQTFPPVVEKTRSEKHVDHFSSNCSDKRATPFTSSGVHGNPGQSSSMAKRNHTCDRTAPRNVVDQNSSRTPTLTTGEWADSLTDVSVGDLLTEVPDDVGANCIETPVISSSRCHVEIPFTCDSFDAAIAAHISSQHKTGISGFTQNLSSIWDAEETCDAFSFQKEAIAIKQIPISSDAAAATITNGKTSSGSAGSMSNAQNLAEEPVELDNMEEDPMEENPSEPRETKNSTKDMSSLTDIYWPDSLGPLELDVPSCKYYSEDMFLTESLNGLNRLIASSLDAFQNCSFFGFDEKVTSSSASGQGGGASFAGKISKGDSTGIQSLQA